MSQDTFRTCDAMTPAAVLLPTDLAGLHAAAFSLIEADPAEVMGLCRSLREGAARDRWIASHALPCRFEMSAVVACQDVKQGGCAMRWSSDVGPAAL